LGNAGSIFILTAAREGLSMTGETEKGETEKGETVKGETVKGEKEGYSG
jgi:hypothetical protein